MIRDEYPFDPEERQDGDRDKRVGTVLSEDPFCVAAATDKDFLRAALRAVFEMNDRRSGK